MENELEIGEDPDEGYSSASNHLDNSIVNYMLLYSRFQNGCPNGKIVNCKW